MTYQGAAGPGGSQMKGHGSQGCRTNAAGNTIVTKLIGGIMKKERKKYRPLKATEVYSKMYYASCVQPAVKEELDAMKEALDAPDLNKCTIQVVQRQLASQWENETLEVKEEVASLILSKDFILLSGPDPANGSKLDVSSLHIGTTALGNRFNQWRLQFHYHSQKKAKLPMTTVPLTQMEFTPRDTLLTNPSQEAVPAYNFFQDLPPNPQDNDEDCDLDRTILPMPLNYQPPA
ncbi:hypothetical protein BDR04DRAFT_1112581 [Suillus decipiens]|nr:hypothetical protein BDR04DRAFT_1112581 [Suillus decipiens]